MMSEQAALNILQETSNQLGWTRVAFGDVVRKVSNKVDPWESGLERYVAGEHLDTDDLRIRRWGVIGDDYLGPAFHMRFKSGQVLYGSRRTYLRKVALADFEGITANTTYVLETKDPSLLLPELLPFIMQTEAFHDHSIANSKGSVNPYVNFSDIASFVFLLPPIQEQSRLVEVLSGNQQLLEKLEGMLSSLLDLEHAMLKKNFGGKYGVNPHGYPASKLSEIALINSGLAKGKKASEATVEMLYLRVANVKDGELDLKDVKKIVVDREKISRYALQYGDVLMTEGGDLDKLGRGTVWQNEVNGCLHQNHVFAVRVDPEKLDPWYLAALARSPYGRSYFRQSAKRSSNLASINKGQVSQMIVPHPALDEQREWLKGYSHIRRQQDETRQRIQACKAFGAQVLRKGLNRDI
ncbi:restriction endonuclease subunit S [Halomonas sediminis]